MNLKLVKASAEYRSQISEMMEEWNSYGEKIVLNILVRRSRQSGVARATIPD